LVKAESLLKELLTAAPDSPVVHAQVGWLRLAKKEAAGATAEFQRAVQLDPTQLDAVSGLVAQDLAAGRQEEARSRAKALVDQAPASVGPLTLAGRTNLMTGRFEDAEGMLNRAIEADPSALEAYSTLGQVYLQQRRLEDARKIFEQRAKRESRPVEALTMVGLIYEMQQRTDDARKVFEQVLSLDPNATVAANNLAWIYAENGGNLDVALQLAKVAQAALPDSPETSDTLGWVYLKKEIYDLSISTFRRAVEVAPTNAKFQYHLGLAYARSGDKNRAKTTLQTALRLKSDFDGAADAKRVLDGL
jgi:Flp pilus assembly protein TadD